MRLFAPILIFFAVLLPALAQTAPAPGPRPTAMTLLPDTAKGHFGQPLAANAFPETQQRQLILLTFDKAAAGETLTFSIRARSTTASVRAVIFQTEAKISDEGLVPIHVRLPSDWPVGTYDVIVSRGDQAIAALPYRVVAEQPRVAALTFGDVVIERVVGPGKVEPAEPVKAGYRHLNFSVTATGANTNGVNLTWVFTALDTTAGAQELRRVDEPGRPVENTDLQFDIALSRDWPLGRFRIDLFVDGKPAVSRGFTIEK